ncbi:MAG: hypothetical protein ACTSUF_10180 [Candidatus Heimdallarchaeaceae archaeon]
MKQYFINIVEYGIMNRKWEGWRMGRIELHKKGEAYAIYEGFIRLPEEAFQALRDELDFKEYDKLPILDFNYEEEK